MPHNLKFLVYPNRMRYVIVCFQNIVTDVISVAPHWISKRGR